MEARWYFQRKRLCVSIAWGKSQYDQVGAGREYLVIPHSNGEREGSKIRFVMEITFL